MKHVANRKKIVSPLPRKSFTQPKTAKKASTAAKSGKQTSTKTIKIAAKSAPLIVTRNAKPKAASVKKEIADTNSKSAVSSNKKKSIVGKIALAADKQIVNGKTEKIASGNTKIKIQKSKPTVAVKKNETVKLSPVKIKPKAAHLEEAKPAKTASKVSTAKLIVKVTSKPPEVEKKQAAKSVTQTLKIKRAKAEKPASINKTVENGKKIVTRISPVKTFAAPVKTEPAKSASKKTNQKTSPIKSALTVEKSVPKTLKIESPFSPSAKNRMSKKASPTNTEILLPEANETKKVAAPEIKAKTRKIKAVEIQAAAPVETVSSKKTEPVEPPIEVADTPLPKPRKKKVKPLGAAIFRGKKERYDFQVFPIEGEFEDAAAIFIISRRVTDKNKRAHHRMVCIGQTDSVLSELKKHRKGRCFKQYKANAISVLREENEQKRLKIEADLKSAHQIPCPHA